MRSTASEAIVTAAPARRFSAYSTDETRCRAHAVADAADFVEAAIAFAERWGSGEGEVSVTVVDCDTGEQQCFQIDLATGETGPC